MIGFTLRRLGAALVLLAVVLTATFFLIHLAPGDPLLLFQNPRSSAAAQERLRAFYGLDRPLFTQYLIWLKAVLRGDWGISISHQRSAAGILLEKIPSSLVLAVAAVLLEYGLGISLGMWAAARAGSLLDRHVRILSLVLFAVPIFWLGPLAIDLFAVRLGLFPSGQMTSDGAAHLPAGERLADLLHHLALPALTLGLARCGGVLRFVRSGLIEALSQDYVRTARAVGLGPARILWVHALKNAAGPLVQRFGLTFPALLSGALLIEVIFGWPGLGQATYSAILERDYPVILASTALSGILAVTASFITDLFHARIDPRIRDAG